MTLIQFKDLADAPVYINPTHVAIVRRYVISDLQGPVAEWAEVVTSGGAVAVLKMKVAEVVKKLR